MNGCCYHKNALEQDTINEMDSNTLFTVNGCRYHKNTWQLTEHCINENDCGKSFSVNDCWDHKITWEQNIIHVSAKMTVINYSVWSAADITIKDNSAKNNDKLFSVISCWYHNNTRQQSMSVQITLLNYSVWSAADLITKQDSRACQCR